MRHGKKIGEAVRQQEEQARDGSGPAACRLGDRYRDGDGVQQNWEEAFRWYSLGARAGDAESQNNLGTMYLNGIYTPEDVAQAVHWYTLSAAQGSDAAQYNLAKRYLHGSGVPQDYAEAKRLFEESAAQDYAFAFNEIGAMYLQGHGMARDPVMAATFFLDAAVRGDDLAVTNLGALVLELEDLAYAGSREAAQRLAAICFEGCGVPKNLEQGYAWVLWAEDLAKASGHQPSESLLDGAHAAPFHLDELGRKRARRLFRAMKHEQDPENKIHDDPENPDGGADAEPHGDLGRWRDVCSPAVPPRPEAYDAEKGEVILKLGAEMGGISLFGISGPQGWTFRCEFNDESACLLDEPPTNRSSEAAGSWLAAREQLDTICRHWYRLVPIYAHPKFRKEILETVERKFSLDRLGIGLVGEK